MRDRPITAWRSHGGVWQRHGATVQQTPQEDHLRLDVSAADAEQLALAVPVSACERFFGLGERFNTVELRGHLVELWVRNAASGEDAYKPVPVVLSTAGWGLALEGDARAFAAVAHPLFPGQVLLAVVGRELRARFFEGDTLKDLIEAYSGMVGRPSCPPPWSFGLWKSRDWRIEDERTVQTDLAAAAAHALPFTVKLIDAGWSTEPNNFIWDPKKYKDPSGLITQIREAGLEVALWVAPWFVADSEIEHELKARGFLLRGPDGAVSIQRLANSPTLRGSLLDFTHPGAVQWWQQKIRELMELGVRAIKTDFGEQVPEEAVFFDGRRGDVGHNAYPRLYNAATFQCVQPYGGMLLARSGYSGSQGLSAVWAGDQSADFGPATGLVSAVRAGLSAGCSGFPFWGSDIGGYFSSPTPECLVRWAEFAAYTPIMEIHGLGEHDPWAFGAETLDAFRRLAVARAELFPYLYGLGQEAARTGVPMMRPLALEFPEDQDVFAHDFAEETFMCGPALLVAPVLWDGQTRRRLYLPRGTDWVPLEGGLRLTGGAVVEASAPLGHPPVFVRAGSLLLRQRQPLPLGHGARELRLYGWGQQELVAYDGCHIRVRRYDEELELEVTGAPGPLWVRALRSDGSWQEAVLAAGEHMMSMRVEGDAS